MSVLPRLAYFHNRRDETPNQELAQDLAARSNRAGIREIAENLWNAEVDIQADCIKVLYEVGAIRPQLIAGYVDDFLKLLQSKNNRLVWGGMTALAAIADIKAAEIYAQRAVLLRAMETGSVITNDNGIQTLARVAASAPARRQKLFPLLLRYLETCRLKDVPQYAEKIQLAVGPAQRAGFKRVLEKRLAGMSSAQAARVKKILRDVEKRER
jgi:hypothetical protein